MTQTFKESPPDLYKTLNDWALAAGRYLQSKQTGYVHVYYGENLESQSHSQTIPLVENALFALALFRSRLVEQIQEAKSILKGLLAFQNVQSDNSYGNFPVYLHSYPICEDSALGLQLLAPFYWIIKQFGHILGVDLKIQMEKSARLALEYSLRAHSIKPFPYSLEIRLAAAQSAYGTLWGNRLWQQEGDEWLMRLAEKQLERWVTTKHLSDILIGLQMVYPSLLNSPWKELWNYMEKTWHHSTGCYVGPCIKEWQEQEEPQVNLYDLYGGYFSAHFSRRATLLRPYHLQGILVQASSDKFGEQPLNVKGHVGTQAWQTVYSSLFAYTVLEKKEENPHSAVNKMVTPFRFIWGDLHRVHSLVCQGGHYENVEYVVEERVLKLIFQLSEHGNEEGVYPQREIEFFADFHPDFLFTLDGQSTMTFALGQKVLFSLGERRFSLRFDLLEGEGTFLGHIMRGNRPSQMSDKGDKRFHSYDWTFFLRTIRRQRGCRIQAILDFL